MTNVFNFDFLPSSSVAVISISIILLFGFLATRLTKLIKLPDVTAYILTGILLGQYVFNVVPMTFVRSTDFLPDLALSFIAFSTGEFFKIDALRKGGIKVIISSIIESSLVAILIYSLARFIFHLSMPFSLVLSSLAIATAPASIMMTIRTTGAKGEFVENLLQTIALDDVLALLVYSIAVEICRTTNQTVTIDIIRVITPIITNLIAIAVGAFFGLVLKTFIQEKSSNDNRLIIAIAIIIGYCGLCTVFDVSPLLGCMAMATVYINISENDRLFKQLNYFTPPILLLFFVRSGLNFNIGSLFETSNPLGSQPLLLISITYFIIRIIGKYSGSYIGSKITGKTDIICKYLGLALFPQAGVVIGLAALGARVIGGIQGEALNTIIVTSSIMYEIVGPICAKLALQLSGSYSNKLEDITNVNEYDEQGKHKSSLELLIERINQIQEDLPKHDINEDEKAYEEAIEEMEYYYSRRRKR